MIQEIWNSLIKTWRKLRADERGNVLMIFGFAVIPITFAVGMGVDYSRAMKAQTKLNAAADAAALTAVSQGKMLQTTTNSCAAARAMFESQSSIPDVTIDSVTYTFKNSAGAQIGCDNITSDAAPVDKRYVTVTYRATSRNYFGGILGLPSLTLSGSSGTYASVAPNIDFYIALDTSPSMALPTTTAGITTLHTPLQCSFACHSNKIEVNVPDSWSTGHMKSLILNTTAFFPAVYTSTNALSSVGTGTSKINIIDASGAYVYDNKTWASGTPASCKSSASKDICVRNSGPDGVVGNSDDQYADSYWYALNRGLPLRVTDETQATKDLLSLAQTYSAINKATYRAALYTFDHGTNLRSLASLSLDLSAVSAAANNVAVVTVNDRSGNGRPPNGTSGTEYLFTSFNSILTKMSDTSVLPNPGTGGKTGTPQAYLFIVTDGMSDEAGKLGTSTGISGSNGRTRSSMQTAQITQCTALKNRGVKIAILYTEYTDDSVKDDESGQLAIVRSKDGIPAIATQLTKCASPGLMYTVRTDESITNALQALFSKALATARIIQ